MGGCSVVGCRNRFSKGKLHFYRFPKDERRKIWSQFTRKGGNFFPKGSATICEVHFAKECFIEKKDRVHLSKNAVPTIFYKETHVGLEMIEVSYDKENKQYFGQESMQLLRGTISIEDEEAVTNRRQQRLDELKTLCRFCFCYDPKNESKCISLSKLDVYQIDANEIFLSLGLTLQSEEVLGELICEQCFQQIVEIDLFKKKCREAQEEIFSDLQELENKIQEIRNTNTNTPGKPWRKSEIKLKQEEPPADSNVIILEEHLIDEEEYEDKYYFDDQQAQQFEGGEECVEDFNDGYQIIYQHVPDSQDEKELFGNVSSSEFPSEEVLETCHMDIQVIPLDDYNQSESQAHGVDEYNILSTDDIIKNPERNRFCFRIYECFFCKMVRTTSSC